MLLRRLLCVPITIVGFSDAAIQKGRRQDGPVPSGTISDCTFYTTAKTGDTCASIASYYDISRAQFISYNPSVKSDCSGIVVGDSYCVEENYGRGPTKTTTTSATMTKPTNTAPSPTQSGLISSCNAFYKVQSGDTCPGIVSKYGTFTLQQFYSWNPAVGQDCTTLYVGYYVCVGIPGTPATKTGSPTATPTGPSPTQTGIISTCKKYYKAVTGDSCSSISIKFGTFTVAQFESWNPAVGKDCTSLLAGYYYCVGIPGTPTAKPSSTKAATPTAPSPTQSGINKSCTKYYLAKSGDSCSSIVSKFGTFTLAQFESWNPAVGSQCTSLLAGYYYCIAIPGTPTKPLSSSSPTPTGKGPQPQQPGIVSNCNKYYRVPSGKGCYDVEQANKITAAQFFKWNTGIKSDCSNMYAGYYVCVGTS